MDATEVIRKQELALEPDTGISLQQWIFERVQAFISGRVLEISDGLGIIAPVCAQNGIHVEANNIDLANDDFEDRYAEITGIYDTLIILNAGEQIKSDRNIITNSTQLLKQGGHLITRLPARTALFNGLDQGFRQWKYHNMDYINKVLRKECRIIKTRYIIIDHDPPASVTSMSRYSERVTMFSKSSVTGMLTGLSMIIVGQKR